MPAMLFQIKKTWGASYLLWQTPAKNNSQFMGHARASDLTQSLIKRLKDLDYANKMVQVSMYGPNVIWSLLDNLAIHQKKENASEPDLVNTGSCCLYVVRRSFGTASKKVDWNLKASLFFFFYKNFKDSSACGADHLVLSSFVR